MSRLLITEENAAPQPVSPSPDTTKWRAAGAISQQANPLDQNHYSLLDHLRHLLAFDPTLEPLGLHGGLSPWLYRNTGQLRTFAQSALQRFDTKDAVRLHSQLVQMLDYLDGVHEVAADAPGVSPLAVDSFSAQIGLLQIHAYQGPPGYLYHIGLHLAGLVASPGATADQQKIANSIIAAISVIQSNLEQVSTIVKQLVALSPGVYCQRNTYIKEKRMQQIRGCIVPCALHLARDQSLPMSQYHLL